MYNRNFGIFGVVRCIIRVHLHTIGSYESTLFNRGPSDVVGGAMGSCGCGGGSLRSTFPPNSRMTCPPESHDPNSCMTCPPESHDPNSRMTCPPESHDPNSRMTCPLARSLIGCTARAWAGRRIMRSGSCRGKRQARELRHLSAQFATKAHSAHMLW